MSDEQNEEVVAPSPVELEAREHGWRPKEEFEADEKNAGKKWRTAEDFMDRKSFFDKIDTVNQENKTLKKAVQQLSIHHANVEKIAYKKALEELKAQRKAALEENDLVKAEEIRDQMDEVKEQINNVAPPVQVQEEPPELAQFKARNTWYQKDRALTRYADSLGRDLIAQGMSPAEILKQVEEAVREDFPEKFRNPNRDEAPEMVTSGRKSVPTERFRLTEDEERVWKNFEKAGVPMTRDEYVADIKKLRGN
jgi:hypothetical protein